MSSNLKISFFLTFLFPTGLIYGQSEIDKYLQEITNLKSFSGTVIISVKDEIIIHKGFGYADNENQILNSEQSVHRIGSLTKQMTSMGILRLFGSNKSLSLDDTIGQYMANLPEAWKQITVFHLLTHTSGIPDHFGDLDAVPVEDTFKEIEKVFEKEKNGELKNIPGETYSYSNFGYVILGRIIEIVSGENYADYLTKEIFNPLDMNNTYYDDPRIIIQGRSEGYKFSEGKRVNDALKDPAAYSAGGILSTTEDLYKWSKSLKTDIILDQNQRELMFTPYKNDYGLGWQILNKNGRKMYNHNGSTHGYNSRIVYYPKEDVFIAILGNNEDIRAAAITCDIEALIFNDQTHLLAFPYNLKNTELQNFVGVYQSQSGDERRIELKDNKLFYVNGGSKFELTALSEDIFCLSKYEDFRLRFSNKKTLEISSCSANTTEYKRK